MKLRIVLTACLALLLVLGARWFLPSDRAVQPTITAPDTRFDYTLSDFHARFRNAEDIVELEVSGPRLEHVAGERIGLLTSPQFHIEPEGANWRGRAGHGMILREDEELILERAVELTHPHRNGEIIIRAERLHHHRGERTITSDQPVEVRQAGSWLHAGGMIIRLDDNIIELTNHVQGQIQPYPRTDIEPAGNIGNSQ